MHKSDVKPEALQHRQPLSPGNDLPGSASVAGKEAGQTAAITHWSRRRVAIFATLWVVGVVLLVLLSFAASANSELPGDVGIARWIQQLHQPVLAHIVNFASDANWPYPAGATAIAVVVVFLLFRRFRAAICTALVAFGADFTNLLINSVVARARPNNIQIKVVAHLGQHSYPSGHVTHAIAFYGFLLYLSIRASRARPRWRPWLLLVDAICLYMMIFVGPARVLEGEHWPSDILASYLLGGLVLLLVIALYHMLAVWRQKRQSGATA